jgi:transporter family-2 protein
MAALCIYGTALIALLIAIPVTGATGFASSKAAQVPWWAWLGGLLSIMSTMAQVHGNQRLPEFRSEIAL